MTDRFAAHNGGLDAPATHGFGITPHDVNELAEVTRAVFVSTGGTLVVQLAGGSTVTFPIVPSGTLLPIRVSKVLVATTATGLVGLL